MLEYARAGVGMALVYTGAVAFGALFPAGASVATAVCGVGLFLIMFEDWEG